MFDRYTDEIKKAIYYGTKSALHQKASVIDSTHLLLGLLTDDDSRADSLFGLRARLPDEASHQAEFKEKSVLNQQELVLKQTPLRSVDREKKTAPNTVRLSPDGKRTLAYAVREANGLRDYWAAGEHLVLGILREGDNAAAVRLRSIGLDLETSRQRVMDNRGSRPPMPDPVLFWVRQRPIGFALGLAFMLGVTTALVLLGVGTVGILFTIVCLALFGLPRYVRRLSSLR